MTSKETSELWKYVDECAERVKKWPEWKRNIRVTKYFKGNTILDKIN